MKTKFKRVVTAFLMLLTLASCTTKKPEEEAKADTFTIKVIDADDEILGEKSLEVDKYLNIYEALTANFDVDGSIGDYGAYITSINNSVVDPNWSMMLYIDDVEANNSCDQIVPAKDSIYKFVNTCWAAIDYGFGTTMSSNDVLLDKYIFHYMKNEMKQSIEKISTFDGGTYWEMLALLTFKEAYPTSNLTNFTFKDELKNSITSCDLSTLTGTGFGKYYAHAKVLNLVSEDFKTTYENYLNTISDSFNPWTSPFELFPAAFLQIKNDKLNTLATDSFKDDDSFGPDANLWQYLCQSLFCNRSTAIDLASYKKDWGNGASNALVLACYAASGLDCEDFLPTVLSYYNEESKLIGSSKTDTTITYSTNQLYAYLISYKVSKTAYGKSVNNILGPINY